MRTIYKYPFEITDFFALRMPAGAVIRAVQMQGSVPCMWAEVDSDRPATLRNFNVFGTGHPMPEYGERGPILDYLGTIQFGQLVFHVYEIDNQ